MAIDISDARTYIAAAERKMAAWEKMKAGLEASEEWLSGECPSDWTSSEPYLAAVREALAAAAEAEKEG